MAVKNSKDLYMRLLSQTRQGTERMAKLLRELGQAAQDPEIEEALGARAFVSEKIVSTIDEAFEIIGENPIPPNGHLHDVFAEDFRGELAEIQSSEARRIFILIKANQLIHLRIGEYVALAAAANVTGHNGVGVLMESCLADTLGSVERTRQLIQSSIETKVAARAA